MLRINNNQNFYWKFLLMNSMHQYQGNLGSELWWVDLGQLEDTSPGALSQGQEEEIKWKSSGEITYELPSQVNRLNLGKIIFFSN